MFFKFLLSKASLFCCYFVCFWCIFSCLFWVVSTRASAWKHSSPKWPVMCWAGRKTLLTHSGIGLRPTHDAWFFQSLHISFMPIGVRARGLRDCSPPPRLGQNHYFSGKS